MGKELKNNGEEIAYQMKAVNAKNLGNMYLGPFSSKKCI
jgi:hypothetical protein